MKWHADLQFGVVAFSDCLAFLAVNSSSLNRQDAKNAKVGFMELSRLYSYKALSKEYCPAPRTTHPAPYPARDKGWFAPWLGGAWRLSEPQ
jgi:hypothetical protein